MSKRGRPPKEQISAEELLQAEQLACLGEAKKLREMLMEQVKKLMEQMDGPQVPADTRLEVLNGLAETYTKIIKSAETVGKYAKVGSGGETESLEELLKP